jgi:hypothetical protein
MCEYYGNTNQINNIMRNEGNFNVGRVIFKCHSAPHIDSDLSPSCKRGNGDEIEWEHICGRGAGVVGSEDAGMSTRNGGEDPPHRKPKGSGARFIRSGSAGPSAEAARRRRGETGQDSCAVLSVLIMRGDAEAEEPSGDGRPDARE